MTIVEINNFQYSIDAKLMKLWERNSLENIKKQNTDKVYIVDGRERIGKSTFAIQQMGAIDKQAFSSIEEFEKRICFSADKFNKACREIKNGVIIFDEAFRGLSSRAALSKINKVIIQTLMEMGQNNNIVFIILPRIFMLDVYPAMLRSNGLFHIDVDKSPRARRIWRGYNEVAKNKIYQIGTRKGWSYPVFTPMMGHFPMKFAGGEEFKKAYDKMKDESFAKGGSNEEVEEVKESYLMKKRNDAIRIARKRFKTRKEFYDAYVHGGGNLSQIQIDKILKEYTENTDKMP